MIADRFELGERAAQGAMGSVYRAIDHTTGHTVAIKILNLTGESDRARFVREANLLALLHHEHVVRYVAHGVTADKTHYLVEEWVDGVSLRHHLRTTGVTAHEAVEIVSGLVDALEAAHALAIVHRDVKPDNIILAGGDLHRLKLVDFGVARMTEEATRLTRTGTVVGTPSYMSPEQARGSGAVEPSTDVWAIGCVLYEMLAGRQAFAGRTPTAVRAKVLLDTPPSIKKLCPEAVQTLVVLLESMLARDPAKRPAIDEVRAILRLVRVGEGPRRVVGSREPTTQILRPIHGDSDEAPSCYIFFGVGHTHEEPADLPALVAAVAERHDFDLYPLEDGSAVLVGRIGGRAGALAAARAALALKAHVPDAAISVVAHRNADAVDATIERGAQAFEQASMGAVFGGVVEAASNAIRIDAVVAELVKDELDVEVTDDGPLLLDSIATNRR